MPKLSNEKKQERRELILNKAFEQFAKKGYAATGMRDIIAACNMSKGGLYTYFDSKRSILLNVIERFDKKKRFEINESMSASEMLSTYITGRLRAMQEKDNQKYVRIALEFWGFVLKDQTLMQITDNRYEYFKDTLYRILQKGISSSEFQSQYPVPNIVYHIMCSINGAAVLSSYMGRVITDQEIAAIVCMHLDALTGKGVKINDKY